MAKKPQCTMITIKPKMLEEIVKNHIRDLQVEAEAGEHEARSIDLDFKNNDDWEDVAIPAVQVSVFF